MDFTTYKNNKILTQTQKFSLGDEIIIHPLITITFKMNFWGKHKNTNETSAYHFICNVPSRLFLSDLACLSSGDRLMSSFVIYFSPSWTGEYTSSQLSFFSKTTEKCPHFCIMSSCREAGFYQTDTPPHPCSLPPLLAAHSPENRISCVLVYSNLSTHCLGHSTSSNFFKFALAANKNHDHTDQPGAWTVFIHPLPTMILFHQMSLS